MKRFVVRFLASLGVILLLAIAFAIFALVGRKGHVPSKTILEANFETPMVEDIPDDPVAQALLKDRVVVRDVVDALDRGSNDDRVVGLVAKIGAVPMGMAEVQELREAVLRFREHKKFAIAFSESFGEFGPGNNAYYLATAFDHIYMQPSGDVGLTGLMLESPFIKNTLSKLGMSFHGDHRYEYKTALNLFTESQYTPANKEENAAVLNSWFGQVRDAVSDSRHIPPDLFQAVVDKAPYLGQQAVDVHLVDGLGYRDEIYDRAKKQAGDDAELLYLSKYLDRAGRPHDSGKTIALIYGVGGVTRGQSGYNPVQGTFTMGSDTVAAAIHAAVDDDDVKAILFRVDSPGGSYVASDAIWREVRRSRQHGKAVIVSMGDLAGSGGYFVAMEADKIVAQPGTITASIGVLGGKMLTSGLWDKLGVTWDEVHAGANADMWTGTHDYSPAEWQKLQEWLDRVYQDFTTKVADGRHMPKDKVLDIAKGRIWTGQDAKNLGLVDALGGFDTALKLVKQAANIPEGDDVKLVVFPHKKTFWQSLLEREGPDNSEKEVTSTAMVETLRTIQPLARQLDALGIKNSDIGDEVLKMPQVLPGK